jgi:ABC-type transporter Mla MlaB component
MRLIRRKGDDMQASMVSVGAGRCAVKGVVDFTSSMLLLEQGNALLAVQTEPRVEIDFSSATVMNSTGVALMVLWCGYAKTQGKTVVCTGLSDALVRMLELYNVSEIVGA